MLSRNILTAEAMLFDVMKRCLPTESYLKFGVIDTIETDLPKPKMLADCVGKLNTYIQDVQIAVNLLSSLGRSNNVQINSLHIYNVLNGQFPTPSVVALGHPCVENRG
eukprot:2570089-Amphidinium_carterae.5